MPGLGSPPSRGRIARLAARLLYAVVAMAIIWLAAARWNGVPAAPGLELWAPDIPPIEPERDRTEALAAARTMDADGDRMAMFGCGTGRLSTGLLQ